jgi:hypothetical protein
VEVPVAAGVVAEAAAAVGRAAAVAAEQVEEEAPGASNEI